MFVWRVLWTFIYPEHFELMSCRSIIRVARRGINGATSAYHGVGLLAVVLHKVKSNQIKSFISPNTVRRQWVKSQNKINHNVYA